MVPRDNLKSWDEFVSLVSTLEKIGSPGQTSYAFRGQARTGDVWPLLPSLTRYAKLNRLNAKQTLALEKNAVKEFKRQAHLYLSPSTIPRDEKHDIGWWVLMQQHRAPTRLLDWTASPYVAAYFAVEQEPDYPGEVWLVCAPILMDFVIMRNYPKLEAVISKEDAPRTFAFRRPNIETAQMGAQQTLFSISAQVLADHGEAIAEVIPEVSAHELVASRHTIPKEKKPEFLWRLRQMNITARALFPGLDTLGRSVAELVRISAQEEGSENTAKDANDIER